MPTPSALFTLLHYSAQLQLRRRRHGAGALVPAARATAAEAEELGAIRLVELLGRGGMGEVWRAEHRLLARSAAIKLVRPDVLGGEQPRRDARLMLRRFEREAQATAGAQLAAHHSGVRLRRRRRTAPSTT